MPNPVSPKRKEPEVSMISANDARKITDDAQFRKSGYASLIDAVIREASAGGKSEVSILFPPNVAEQAAQFIVDHGFRITAKITTDSVVITAAW